MNTKQEDFKNELAKLLDKYNTAIVARSNKAGKDLSVEIGFQRTMLNIDWTNRHHLSPYDLDGKQSSEERGTHSLVVPEGYALVPIKPTLAMREAFHKAYDDYEEGRGTMPDSGWTAILGEVT